MKTAVSLLWVPVMIGLGVLASIPLQSKQPPLPIVPQQAPGQILGNYWKVTLPSISGPGTGTTRGIECYSGEHRLTGVGQNFNRVFDPSTLPSASIMLAVGTSGTTSLTFMAPTSPPQNGIPVAATYVGMGNTVQLVEAKLGTGWPKSLTVTYVP